MDGDVAPIAAIVALAEKYNALTYHRRSPRGRPLWTSGRGLERARRPCGAHRHHRGHAREGLRLARRLYRGERGDRRRGQKFRAPVHLHLDPAAERRRERSRRGQAFETSTAERERHQHMAKLVKHALRAAGLPVMDNPSHIVPVLRRRRPAMPRGERTPARAACDLHSADQLSDCRQGDGAPARDPDPGP